MPMPWTRPDPLPTLPPHAGEGAASAGRVGGQKVHLGEFAFTRTAVAVADQRNH